jgi:hypothetical protein
MMMDMYLRERTKRRQLTWARGQRSGKLFKIMQIFQYEFLGYFLPPHSAAAELFKFLAETIQGCATCPSGERNTRILANSQISPILNWNTC